MKSFQNIIFIAMAAYLIYDAIAGHGDYNALVDQYNGLLQTSMEQQRAIDNILPTIKQNMMTCAQLGWNMACSTNGTPEELTNEVATIMAETLPYTPDTHNMSVVEKMQAGGN